MDRELEGIRVVRSLFGFCGVSGFGDLASLVEHMASSVITKIGREVCLPGIFYETKRRSK